MPELADVETEVLKLRSEIDKLEKDQVTKRAAADKLRDDALAGGFDVTKLASDSATRDTFEKIDAAYKEPDDLKDRIMEMRAGLEKMYGWTGRTGAGTSPAGPAGSGPRQRLSLGRRLTEASEYQTVKQNATSAKAEFRMGSVEVMSRAELQSALRVRAGLDLTSGQQLVTPDYQLIPPVELPVRQVKLIDLIDVQTTDSDAVVWAKQTTRTLAAAPTATGANAPQATLAFVRVTSNVHRIPVILTVPKEVMADEGRIQGILDKQLIADARITTENQVLAGDGTGENFLGILNTSGIGAVTQGSTGHAGEYALDAIHRAITYVRLHLFDDPDGIGLHPQDLETVVLQKDTQKRYIFAPTEDQASIWGFPAVASAVFTAGTGVVGNYRMGATLWLRDDVAVTATDGYTDVASGINYFSAGLVALMAQIRAAFAVERPFAFCEVTSLAAV